MHTRSQEILLPHKVSLILWITLEMMLDCQYPIPPCTMLVTFSQ